MGDDGTCTIQETERRVKVYERHGKKFYRSPITGEEREVRHGHFVRKVPCSHTSIKTHEP